MLRVIGINPMAAAGVIAIDSMLFGGTVFTGGVGYIASIPVGIATAIAVCLIQNRGFPRDDLGLAAGKGIMVGLLTAIPTPLPSVFVFGAGTAGALVRKRRLDLLEGDSANSQKFLKFRTVVILIIFIAILASMVLVMVAYIGRSNQETVNLPRVDPISWTPHFLKKERRMSNHAMPKSKGYPSRSPNRFWKPKITAPCRISPWHEMIC